MIIDISMGYKARVKKVDSKHVSFELLDVDDYSEPVIHSLESLKKLHFYPLIQKLFNPKSKSKRKKEKVAS